MKRILALVLLVAIAVGGYLYYQKYKKDKALTDGSFTCVGCLTPEQAAAYDKYDHGEGPRPDSRKPAATATDNTQNPAPAPSASASQSASAAENPAGYTATDTNQVTPVIIPPGNTSLTRPVAATTPASGPAPVSDSVAPNPQNGLRFGGSGAYQWYREGNLTWRVNTQTGSSCIIYATMEEWRKRIVMDHGCGRNA